MFDWLKTLWKKNATAKPVSSSDDAPFNIDAYRRLRPPTAWELLQELKNTAYTCATINASTCASYPPKLFVKTGNGQRGPKCLTKSLPPSHRLAVQFKDAAKVEEVVEHPLLTLLQNVNPRHNAYDLWELTTLYQECHGSAYWLVEDGALTPDNLWILPSQQVTPMREKHSGRLVDYYLHRVGSEVTRYRPEQIIHFSYPDPRDPYTSGLSPLRAAFEIVSLGSNFLAYRRSVLDNHALPGAIISPEEVISEEEAERFEKKWNQKFRRGGNGKVVVAESALSVSVLGAQLGDVAALAEAGATKEDVANAFLVPITFLVAETNLANLQAAERQHGKWIWSKLQRRDQKINEQLVPRYDDTGRLFVASDDPRESDRDFFLRQEDQDLRRGVRTINEVRADRGLPPVPWGNEPYKPSVAESLD